MRRPSRTTWLALTGLAGLLLACRPARGQDAVQDPPSAARPYGLDPGQEAPAPPATPPPSPDPYPDGPPPSQFLSGDLFGLRPAMDDLGLTFYSTFTQFEQGVASGGFDRAARWGGKFELLSHADSGRLGLWDGGAFDLYAEARLGSSVDGPAGVYSPTNLAMFFPLPDQEIMAITGLKYTQQITERSGIFLGKLNALNGDREKFLRYPLTARFWNAAFNFNLALDRYPYSAPGAGFYVMPERGPQFAFLVLDSFDSPRTSGLQKLGRNGVFLYAEAKQATRLYGLPGRQVLAGLFGTGSFADLDPASFLVLPAATARTPKKDGTWTLLWNIEQRLWVDPAEPDRGLGLYIQLGLGDGNPNPVRSFASVAVCGNSPLPGRPTDTFGVGFYHLGLGDAVRRLAPGLRDEPGVELFYNLKLGAGCHLTPDLQVIRPGLAAVEPAVVLGLRLKMDF